MQKLSNIWASHFRPDLQRCDRKDWLREATENSCAINASLSDSDGTFPDSLTDCKLSFRRSIAARTEQLFKLTSWWVASSLGRPRNFQPHWDLSSSQFKTKQSPYRWPQCLILAFYSERESTFFRIPAERGCWSNQGRRYQSSHQTPLQGVQRQSCHIFSKHKRW